MICMLYCVCAYSNQHPYCGKNFYNIIKTLPRFRAGPGEQAAACQRRPFPR
jgi:hypothetical protein